MFFCEPDQVFYQDDVAILGGNMSVAAPEHLVNFTINDTEVGLGQTLFERREGEVETIFIVAEMPGLYVVARNVIEFDLVQLVDVVVQDESVLGGCGQVTETETQVQAEGAAIG